jgi:proteasome lid subunit RPN8/RPN11
MVTAPARFQVWSAARDALVAHAHEEAPLECCGLLLGRNDTVEESARARNVRRSRTSYLIDPADHFAAIRRVRAEGRAIVGAYHSHPLSAPVPSESDVREALYREFLYLIVSLTDPAAPDLRGYICRGSEMVPVPLNFLQGP